ncbi:YbaB/EbfC family nucleoid-associated protein [Planctomyces sp. SH-PL62]|uniref:YbaB/EbfC family nucleoid-associated protein n=1 Tax=Planctomyces sp. SH-PL62 TaxID=1636152 RepID=UPI00078BE348|nr:YbaB/EbfC family nucleoid-associated protein [Planctomyces sp. SH-PL62]AMV37243.1 Nucleoid-associated protein YbaB [Planctomyces sp. SH-PL62]
MFGKIGDIADLMKNAGKIRESMAKAAEALGKMEAQGEAGGGAVLAKINGRMEILSIRIDPKLVADGDVELLEDLVAAAVNAALVKVRENATQSLTSLTGGIPPNLFPNEAGGS